MNNELLELWLPEVHVIGGDSREREDAQQGLRV
jgi:hypothetical protein